MAKGYTLSDLQSITKIQKRYLSGIENEDYTMMPGSFYVRAFIKQYADAVGLDADEMLALYKESPESALPDEEEQQIASTNLSRRNSGKRSNQLNEVMPKIIVALFIIVILLVLWFLTLNNPSKKQELNVGTDEQIKVEDQQKQGDGKTSGNDVQDKTSDNDAVDDTDDTDTDADKDQDQTEQSLTHVNVAGENSTYSLTGTEKFTLEIRTNGDSWIGVRDRAGEERMPKPRGADTFGAGDSIELDVSDTDYVRIRVGRTASTEIYVNGELLEYASDRTTQNIIIEKEQ